MCPKSTVSRYTGMDVTYVSNRCILPAGPSLVALTKGVTPSISALNSSYCRCAINLSYTTLQEQRGDSSLTTGLQVIKDRHEHGTDPNAKDRYGPALPQALRSGSVKLKNMLLAQRSDGPLLRYEARLARQISVEVILFSGTYPGVKLPFLP